MKVLVLNCGSSSLKFQLIETDEPAAREGRDRTLAKGLVEDTGGTATLHYEAAGKKPLRDAIGAFQHQTAVEKALAVLTDPDSGVIPHQDEIGAVGHRVVHGGERFKTSVLIDDGVIDGIEANIALAPLHNPANLQGYRAARAVLPAAPQVAVFDTSFHQTMPPEAYLYALPYDQYQRFGIRRFGFHGTSHRFVSGRAAALLGRPEDDPGLRLITCHLGNGASVCAIRGGRSVDTSMGFTPLEGLVMGTRCGDLDPAALLYLMGREELGAAEASALMNKRSGLLGLSGLSHDMRTLLEAEAKGNDRARLAINVFCYRLRKYVASYVGALGGVDALVFAGGIGENSPAVRERSLHGLDALGLAADPARNEAARGTEAEISPDGARSRVFVIPTDEELLIARDSFRIVSGLAGTPRDH
ncbi:MAG TPA: acetate kinase [Thermoanaerobaculia bacterium]|jgi:acetate kinase|nr:acetate kinase [Thermoanaerobaculia bacterium]